MNDLDYKEREEVDRITNLLQSALFIIECATTGEIEIDKENTYPLISHLSSEAFKLKKIIDKWDI